MLDPAGQIVCSLFGGLARSSSLFDGVTRLPSTPRHDAGQPRLVVGPHRRAARGPAAEARALDLGRAHAGTSSASRPRRCSPGAGSRSRGASARGSSMAGSSRRATRSRRTARRLPHRVGLRRGDRGPRRDGERVRRRVGRGGGRRAAVGQRGPVPFVLSATLEPFIVIGFWAPCGPTTGAARSRATPSTARGARALAELALNRAVRRAHPPFVLSFVVLWGGSQVAWVFTGHEPDYTVFPPRSWGCSSRPSGASSRSRSSSSPWRARPVPRRAPATRGRGPHVGGAGETPATAACARGCARSTRRCSGAVRGVMAAATDPKPGVVKPKPTGAIMGHTDIHRWS